MNSLSTQRERLTSRLNKLAIHPKSQTEREERNTLESKHEELTRMINAKKVEMKKQQAQEKELKMFVVA
jgi:hypothetical protein